MQRAPSIFFIPFRYYRKDTPHLNIEQEKDYNHMPYIRYAAWMLNKLPHFHANASERNRHVIPGDM